MVAETAGASVSSVARKHGVASSLLFRWRREFVPNGRMPTTKVEPPRFLPVALPAPSAFTGTISGLIEIELAHGRRIRVDASVDASALKRVIAVLEER